MSSDKLVLDVTTLRGVLRDRGAAMYLYERSGRLVSDPEEPELARLIPERVSDMLARSDLLFQHDDTQVWMCELDLGRAAYLVVDRTPNSTRPSILIVTRGPGSENRVLDGLPIGLLTLDAGFQAVNVNHRAGAFLGAADSDLKGSGWQRFFARETLEGLVAHFRTPATASTPYRQTMVLAHDGQLPQYLDVSAVAQWRGSKGTASYCVSLVDLGQGNRVREELGRAIAADTLASLMNRQSFVNTMNALPFEELSSLGIAVIDIDDLKSINDHLGHNAGDEFLRIVTMRIRSAVRDTDFIARTGDDEMMVACRHVATEDQLKAFGQKLDALLNDTISMQGKDARISVSIGLAHGADCLTKEGHAETGSFSECLLKHADAALYEAKAEGGARSRCYSNALNEKIATLEAQQWEYERVVESDALACAFQPIRSKFGVTAVEALTRVTLTLDAHHSINDLIATVKRGRRPHEILDRWTRSAIETYGHFLSEEGVGKEVAKAPELNLNIDVQQILASGFSERLKTWCAHAALPPQKLCLEITEAALEDQNSALTPVLRALRDAGFRLSMDNFGTGDISIKSLLFHEFDQIKIDRFFTEQAMKSPKYQGFLSALVTMGRSASLEIIAEGIENPEEEALCLRLGVEVLQGYHLGRPASLTKVFSDLPLETDIATPHAPERVAIPGA